MKRYKVFFSAVIAAIAVKQAAWAIVLPPHQVSGSVSALGGASLSGCTAELPGVGSDSVADGKFSFKVPIYDSEDNPSGAKIGETMTVRIVKSGKTLNTGSFSVEAGGVTILSLIVKIPVDPEKIDTDKDGIPDYKDPCPTNPDNKDSDKDGVLNCLDECPDDPKKSKEGECGCNKADADVDEDGIFDCKDPCFDSTDTDGDGIPDCEDPVDNIADRDGDGIKNEDDCSPDDPLEHPGQVWYEDEDGDYYGTGKSVVACKRPSGYRAAEEMIDTGDDCDDKDARKHPGAPETAGDGIDCDCDGADNPAALTVKNRYIVPYLNGGNGMWNGVGLTNYSLSAAKALCLIHGQDGVEKELTGCGIAPAGQAHFVVGRNMGGEGWMLVESDQDLVGLAFYGNGKFIADVPFLRQQDLSAKWVIPHIAQGDRYEMLTIVCNPNRSSATVSLEFTDPAGNIGRSIAFAIPAMGSRVYRMREFFSRPDEGSNSGWLAVSSQGPSIAVFAVYHSGKGGGTENAGINAFAVR